MMYVQFIKNFFLAYSSQGHFGLLLDMMYVEFIEKKLSGVRVIFEPKNV